MPTNLAFMLEVPVAVLLFLLSVANLTVTILVFSIMKQKKQWRGKDLSIKIGLYYR